MSERVGQILEAALALPATDRAAVVEQLLSSLDRPDPALDVIWAQEAEARIAAYELGHVETFSMEEAFCELEQQWK